MNVESSVVYGLCTFLDNNVSLFLSHLNGSFVLPCFKRHKAKVFFFVFSFDFFLFFFVFLFVYLFVVRLLLNFILIVCVGTWKRMLNTPRAGVGFVGHVIWVPRNSLRSSARTDILMTTESSLQPMFYFIFNYNSLTSHIA